FRWFDLDLKTPVAGIERLSRFRPGNRQVREIHPRGQRIAVWIVVTESARPEQFRDGDRIGFVRRVRFPVPAAARLAVVARTPPTGHSLLAHRFPSRLRRSSSTFHYIMFVCSGEAAKSG